MAAQPNVGKPKAWMLKDDLPAKIKALRVALAEQRYGPPLRSQMEKMIVSLQALVDNEALHQTGYDKIAKQFPQVWAGLPTKPGRPAISRLFTDNRCHRC